MNWNAKEFIWLDWVVLAIGIGLVLRFGGSTGGTDIIALMVNKYYVNGNAADQVTYDERVTVHIDQATMVLAHNIQVKSEEEASPLLSKPMAKVMNYENMLSYLIKIS